MRSTIPILICCLYALSAVNATSFSKKQNAEVQQGNTEVQQGSTEAAEAPKLWSNDKDNNDDKDDKWSKDGKHGHHDHEDDSDNDCASRSVSILIGTSTYAIPCLPNGSIVDLNGLIAPPASSSSSAAASSSASPGASVCDGTVDSCGDTTCVSCPNPENGQAICISNTCGITCNIGYTDCDGTCVNTQTDPNNCGTCGNSCGIAQCSAGTCVPIPGCYQLNGNNIRDAIEEGLCAGIPPNAPFSQAYCRNSCRDAPYYSLTYQVQATDRSTVCCLCYDSSYHFYPLQPTDPECPITLASSNYGQYSGVPFSFEGPGSEYVYIRDYPLLLK